MSAPSLFQDVLVFLSAAVAVVSAFHWLRISPVLGYLAAGMLIGPHGLGLIEDTEEGHALADLGVVFLLFTIGLELSLERLRVMRRLVFGLGTLQVVVSGLVIGGGAVALGASVEAAVVIGGGLALSSTAFVLQLLKERGEQATRFGRAAFAVLLLQDLAVVPMLTLVPLLARDEPSLLAALGLAALKAAVALAVVAAAGRLLLRPVFRIVAAARNPELFVAAVLLVVLGAGWVMTQGGLSMALGAFLAGVLLSETAYRHQVEADIRPFRGILLGLFFMVIGMAMDLGLVLRRLPELALLVAAVLAAKAVVLAALCRAFGERRDVALRVGLLLAQGGEFGFVLFGAAMAAGLLPPATGQLLLATIALSMVVTPALAALGARLSARLAPPVADDRAALGEAAEHLADHVVIAGFGRVGQTVAHLLAAGGIPYLALDLDHARVTTCRARGLPVFYGDADRIDVLTAAGVERARAAVITMDRVAAATQAVTALRASFPELRIFARARSRRHARLLAGRGATAAVPEAIEASLQLGGIVLDAVGVGRDAVTRLIDGFRAGDYAGLEEITGGGGGEAGDG
ncbi:MAG TPA: monovalent cation:proton antiporter-2 (CPA2) family protein [Geminicoccaceae bacterium]|nr:monovalent cation:proton antiporter-2 (CPA2) family protein [Geminicoccaceae bacterium]